MAGEVDSFIFGGNTGLTYEQLKRRRAVALALASQRRGYPKTVGEGMTYLGESIGDMIAERRLDAAEKGYLAKQGQALAGLMPGAAPAPVSAPARPGAAPTPIAPRPAPPPPIRPPPAPAPPRPQVSMMPVRPAPVDPYGATEGTGGGFEPGSILNPAPIAAPGLQEVFPGEEGSREFMAGPSSGYLPPTATAAAPPSNAPAPATAPPVNALDTAEWPAGPVNAPPTSELQPTEVPRRVGEPAAPGPQSSASPAGAFSGDAPPNVLAQAQQVALQGGPAAVSRFMADAGYPKSGAWCGQFAAAVSSSAGVQPPAGPAVASNWRNVGTPVDTPQIGDVAIARPGWSRRGSGETGQVGSHVTFVNQSDPSGTFQGLGGNQGSMVKPFNAADFEFRRLPGDVQGHRIVGIPGEEPPEAQVASYAQPGVRSDAPPPGIGSAGGNIRMRSDPFQPPAGPAAPAETEQITPVDIEPMPSTAQFGPPTNRFTRTDAPVPGIGAPAAPMAVPQTPPAPAAPPRLPQELPPTAPPVGQVPEPPGFREQLVRPVPPPYPEAPHEYEVRAQRAVAANPGDPVIHEQAKALAAFGKAQRDAAYMREVEEYKKDLDLYNTRMSGREKYHLELPETQQKLRKGETEIRKEEQAIEQGRLSTGAPPASPASDPRLGTPVSPQRSGVPSAGPVPTGVSPQKWSEIEAPIIAKKIEAADKSEPNVNTVLDRINQVRTHPGKNVALGLQGKILGSVHPNAIGFNALLKELQGTAFLQAYEGLKGTGAISEKEGEKAEQAKARLQAVQSPRDFDKALLDLEATIRGDLERAQRSVNKPVTAWRPPGDNNSFAPDIGQIQDGYRYVGGNPALPSSWSK